jgi:hypothetical protein
MPHPSLGDIRRYREAGVSGHPGFLYVAQTPYLTNLNTVYSIAEGRCDAQIPHRTAPIL